MIFSFYPNRTGDDGLGVFHAEPHFGKTRSLPVLLENLGGGNYSPPCTLW
jgi:hypothetical protein